MALVVIGDKAVTGTALSRAAALTGHVSFKADDDGIKKCIDNGERNTTGKRNIYNGCPLTLNARHNFNYRESVVAW